MSHLRWWNKNTRNNISRLVLSSLLYLRSAEKVIADDAPSQEYSLPKPLDTIVHSTVDSVKTVIVQTSALKENLKDKVALLEYQQKEIRRTQHLLDSLKTRDSLTKSGFCLQ